MNKVFLSLAFCAVISESVSADLIFGKVISVIDGNTIEILTHDNVTNKIVLAGIDCPELTQVYGEKARKCLEKMLYNKEVKIEFQGKDRKGNYVALVFLNSLDPRVELLKEGLAWTSEKDPAPELESYRVVAQEKGKGLWKEDHPTPPWIYRRQQSMMQPKTS